MTKYEQLLTLISNTSDGCIVWDGPTTANGYVLVRRHGIATYGHRIACEVGNGPDPGGMDAAHYCGNRACVNPRHLRWATRSENQLDRALHGTSLRGAANQNAKLSTADVLSIKQRFAVGEPNYSIADRYGVDASTISHIRRGRTWGWLEVAP